MPPMLGLKLRIVEESPHNYLMLVFVGCEVFKSPLVTIMKQEEVASVTMHGLRIFD